jgi:hypothetical protein
MARKVFIAMPSMTGKPDLEAYHCHLATMRELERAGYEVMVKFCIRDFIAPRMRNLFLMKFIESGYDDLVFIDDDVSWEDGAMLRLLSHPVDLVAGIYPKRQDKLEYPVKRLDGAELDKQTGLLEVQLLPTGFMRITRKCALEMVEKHQHLAYFEPNAKDGKAYAVFWFDMLPGDHPDAGGLPEIWTEDYSFCRKWREIGGRCYADTYLTFRHIGRKGWEGCYALDRGLLQPQAAE